MIPRRIFLQAGLAAAAAGPVMRAAAIDAEWGGPVIDTHLHLRADPEACFTHMAGCGVTHALLLTREPDEAKAKDAIVKHKGRCVRSVSLDPAVSGSDSVLRAAIKDGAVSIGEMKHHLAIDSPEMQRVYAIAAEMRVPVMMHIQVFPHFPGELPYNTGYDHFDKMLKAHPKTNFVGHGDLFWANIAADVPTDRGYPAGPVKKGGLTDQWLSKFPNLYGDISANSGNNALSRDMDFSRGFVARYQDKLMFGSDCSCSDGHGAGVSQSNNPEAARLAGKCVARETLAVVKQLAGSDAVFRKIAFDNAVRLYRIQAMLTV